MLVVTANWLFGDGSLCSAAGGPHVAAWLATVHRAVLRAGFRRDGSYRPVDAVQLVLAGDTLDCLTTAQWSGRLRPWHAGRAAATARARVLWHAAARGRRLLGPLAKWAKAGLALPAADRRGRPQLGTTTTVPVRVAMLVGDRDPWLDVAADIAARRGLVVGQWWSDGAATVRHGMEFDPCARPAEPRGAGSRGWQPTLAESVAVDLVARFGAAIVAECHAESSAARLLVAAVAAAEPLAIPAVLAAWSVAQVDASLRDRTLAVWRRSVAAWHRETVRQPPSGPPGIAACDLLAALFDAGADGLAAVRPEAVERLAPRGGASPEHDTVLGHPAAATSVGAGRVICLAPQRPAPWSRTVGAGWRSAGPPHSVTRLEDGSWHWLPVPGSVEAEAGPIIPTASSEPTIVDAA